MCQTDRLKFFDEPIDTVDVFNSRAAAVKVDGVAGWSVTKSSLEQINQITKILDENLRQGALGIGSTPGYASQRLLKSRTLLGQSIWPFQGTKFSDTIVRLYVIG